MELATRGRCTGEQQQPARSCPGLTECPQGLSLLCADTTLEMWGRAGNVHKEGHWQLYRQPGGRHVPSVCSFPSNGVGRRVKVAFVLEAPLGCTKTHGTSMAAAPASPVRGVGARRLAGEGFVTPLACPGELLTP